MNDTMQAFELFKKNELAVPMRKEEFLLCQLNGVLTKPFAFFPRWMCEAPTDLFVLKPRQLVVYIVTICLDENGKAKILTYDRKGGEERLHALSSVGVGGHVNLEDAGIWMDEKTGLDLDSTLRCAVFRELAEELGNVEQFDRAIDCGSFELDGSPVDKDHQARVFVTCLGSQTNPIDPGMIGPRWLSYQELTEITDRLESWSVKTLELESVKNAISAFETSNFESVKGFRFYE